MNATTDAVNAICELIEAGESGGKIAWSSVNGWSKSEDIDVLGAVYVLITDSRTINRIEPRLSYGDYVEFLKVYFSRCIIENPKSEWADSRYSAAHDLVNWLKSWAGDKSLSDGDLIDWGEWLAGLYLKRDIPVRESIETGILEHLGKDVIKSRIFDCWRENPELMEAINRSR